MNKKVPSKTFTRLPKLNPAVSADEVFNDEKFQAANEYKSVDENAFTIPTAVTGRVISDAVPSSRRFDLTDRGVYNNDKAPISEDFGILSARNFKSSAGKSTDFKSTSSKIKDFKARMSPDHTISDFYLKNMIPHSKSISDIDTQRMKPMINSSRATHTTLLESVGYRTVMEPRRTGSMPMQAISEDLALFASGRSPKQKFFDSLGAYLRQFYIDKKEFSKLFIDIDIANFCFEEVIERVRCYRSELGNLMAKVAVSYKKIMEKMLELTMKALNDKDRIFEQKMKENLEGIERLTVDKLVLEAKNKQYRTLIEIKESEAKMNEFNLQSLDGECKMLHEMLKKEYLLHDGDDRNKKQVENTYLAEAAGPSKKLADDLIELQQSIKTFEEEQTKKEEALKEMNNLLKAMLKGGKKDSFTQVDEGELAWSMQHLLEEEKITIKKSDMKEFGTSAINISQKIKDGLANKQKMEKQDPVDVTMAKEKLKKDGLLEDEDVKKSEEDPSQPIATQSSGVTEIQRGKLMNMNSMRTLAQALSDSWNLPLPIIVFLENVTKGREMASVLPWSYFRKLIIEIYLDKINNSQEIQNSLVTTYIPMSEYLCLYFLKTYKLRRNAELKLLEFLASLKYYVKHWQRALTFANMCDITNLKHGNTLLMIGTIESFDLYVQNFYLFALSRIMYADPPIVYDHPDGVSYLLKDKIDEVTNDILAFEPETSRRKFLAGIQKHIRFFNDGNTDQEGIDLDKLLHWYIEVFLDSRARNTQIITKNFYKYYQDNTGEGVFSFDEVYGMVKELIDTESPVPGYSYPQELTVCRAFLYALTSGKNSFSISSTDFLNGVARFGVDCPFPFINVAKSSMVLQSMQSLLFPEASSPQRTKSGGGLKKKSSNKNPLTQLPFMKGSDPLAVKNREGRENILKNLTMLEVLVLCIQREDESVANIAGRLLLFLLENSKSEELALLKTTTLPEATITYAGINDDQGRSYAYNILLNLLKDVLDKLTARLKLLGISNSSDAQKLVDRRNRVQTGPSQKQDQASNVGSRGAPQKKESLKNNSQYQEGGLTHSIYNYNPGNVNSNYGSQNNSNNQQDYSQQNLSNENQTPITRSQKQPSIRDPYSLPPSNPLTQQDFYSNQGTPHPDDNVSQPTNPKKKK